jgi:hypothetical protein
MDEVWVLMVYCITARKLLQMQIPVPAKAPTKSARDDAGMENATTVIIPVGAFTSAIERKVADALADAAANGCSIVISLQWTTRCSWDALCELSAALQGRYRDVRVTFTRVAPTRRALLAEVGLDNHWVVDQSVPRASERVLISA